MQTRVSDIRSAIPRCRSHEEHLGLPDLGQMTSDATLDDALASDE